MAVSPEKSNIINRNLWCPSNIKKLIKEKRKLRKRTRAAPANKLKLNRSTKLIKKLLEDSIQDYLQTVNSYSSNRLFLMEGY